MKKCLILLCCLILLKIPVSAVDYTAPQVPGEGADLMPEETQSFLDGILELLENALKQIRPDLQEAAQISRSVLGAAMMMAVLTVFRKGSALPVNLGATAVLTAILFRGTNALFILAKDTVAQMSQYGKLLLPVMTGALAAQGGISASTGLYIGTAFFDSLLGSLLNNLYVPLVYVYLALAIARNAADADILKRLRDMIKGFLSWSLKILLTVFTTYMSITGVVSGATDAAALKATKVTISTVVPVIGGILSDASEAVLVGAGVMKNAAGIYGILAVLALFLGPFLRIGSHYLLLRLTAALCGVLGTQNIASLTEDFSTAMGLMLAITAAMCILLLISTVCFMKGVA